MPQIVPLLVPNERPLGSAGLMAHEVIVPEPVSVALSGKFEVVIGLVKVRNVHFTIRIKCY